MKSSRRFYQDRSADPPLLLSGNSLVLTSIDPPFDMAAEDDEQLDLQQLLWDEGFQEQFLTSAWPISSPPANVTPLISNPPSTPVFTDGRMAISVFPPPPFQEDLPITVNNLPSNDPIVHTGAPLTEPVSTYSTALGFQSDETPAYSWPEELFESPPIDPGHAFGYSPSNNSPMTVEVKSETPSAGSARGEDASYFTRRTSNQWDTIPIHQPIARRASHTPGPERSAKSKSQRVSPLGASQGAKSKHAKRAAACWRCRKYRKPCDNEVICTSCQVGNFRVWPPAIGCRRDNLEGFAVAIIPPSIEDLLRKLPSDLAPLPSWRQSVFSKSLAPEDLFPDNACEKWSPLAVKVHATGLFGMELVDLLNITHSYQIRQKSKNSILESAGTLFSSSCDYYNVFVISAGNQSRNLTRANIATTIQDIRTSIARSLSLFLGLCVSSKRSDWFPSVLAFAICVASLAMFMDAAVAMPEAARTELWEDVAQFCLGLRAQLYPTALDLLRIRANNDKQMAPLELNCWNWVPEKPISTKTPVPDHDVKAEPNPHPTRDTNKSSKRSANSKSQSSPRDKHTLRPEPAVNPPQTPKMVRNPEGMRLIGNDEAAFDGFGELQKWLRANEHILKQGKILFSHEPFTSPTVATASTLAPIFGIR